jgi:glutamine synthetase
MQMVRRQFIPAAVRFATELGTSVKAVGNSASVQKELLDEVSGLLASASKNMKKLAAETVKAHAITDVAKHAAAFRDKVVPSLAALRSDIDALETITAKDLWPVPVYSDLLFKL